MALPYLPRQAWHAHANVGLMVDEVERKERLAFAIEAAMAAQGLEDEDLAKRVGKSATTIGRWRRGDTVPNALEIMPLAHALGLGQRSDLLPETVDDGRRGRVQFGCASHLDLHSVPALGGPVEHVSVSRNDHIEQGFNPQDGPTLWRVIHIRPQSRR